MRFELSPALEAVLGLAGGLARQANAQAIDPWHLLLALVKEEEGQACQRLRQAGLAVDEWKARQRPETWTEEPVAWPPSAAVRAILDCAWETATVHSAEGTITTDQILFALLTQDAELRGQLEQEGLNFPCLQRQYEVSSAPVPLDAPIDFSQPPETFDIARILDANANRAREALRVVEDYCRFVLNDGFLCGEWKRLRHELAQALTEVPYEKLLQARDTQHDVGVAIATPSEQHRESLVAVAQTNAKRLQEALRTLEETAKTEHGELARTLERLRYQSYTLERAMLLGTQSRQRLAEARLYVLVTEATCRHSLPGTVSEALAGGAQVIQLREKSLDDRTLLAKARDVRKLTRAAGALFIMNDRPDLARLTDADGVHLGQDDLPISETRRLLGPEALIGVSTHKLDQVRQAILDGADYIGVGPTFASATKEFSALAGLEFVRQACRETSLPAFVLGGVSLDNVDQVVEAGGRRIAVSQAICAAADPRQTARTLRSKLDEAAKRTGP